MKRKSRTLLERVHAIFDLFDNSPYGVFGPPIPKSGFQYVGISPKDIDQWLELIMFIQQQPLLEVTRTGTRTYVDIRENRFMLLMKRRFLNVELSSTERESALLLYFRSLITEERLKGEEIDLQTLVDSQWTIDRPTVVRIAEEVLEELENK
jgi:hypothetical protein